MLGKKSVPIVDLSESKNMERLKEELNLVNPRKFRGINASTLGRPSTRR